MSTTDAILEFTGFIIDTFEEGKFSSALFFDLPKVFDYVSHNQLMKKQNYRIIVSP